MAGARLTKLQVMEQYSNALLVFTSSTDHLPEARGPHSLAGPRGTQATPDPTYIVTWVHGIWMCQMYPTSTERLGTVFPAGVPGAAAPFCSSTPFTSTPQTRKSASKRDSLFRVILWPNSGHAHNRGLHLLIQRMP